MFKTLRANYVFSELIVSEGNVYFIQKSIFLIISIIKNHPNKVKFSKICVGSL